MEKVKIKFIGKRKYLFFHGSVRETFKPGEEKEVSAQIAEILLNETILVREWDKKTGALESEKQVKIFELVTEKTQITVTTESKGENQ